VKYHYLSGEHEKANFIQFVYPVKKNGNHEKYA